MQNGPSAFSLVGGNTVQMQKNGREALPYFVLRDPLPCPPLSHTHGPSPLILTDSGSIEDEVPSLVKPVLVMRDTTARPEAVQPERPNSSARGRRTLSRTFRFSSLTTTLPSNVQGHACIWRWPRDEADSTNHSGLVDLPRD